MSTKQLLTMTAAGLIALAATGMTALAIQGVGPRGDGTKATTLATEPRGSAVTDSARSAPPASETKPAGAEKAEPLARTSPPPNLAEERLQAAKRWFDTALRFYENGTITTDRLLDASRRQTVAEREASPAGRQQNDANRGEVRRLEDLLLKERARLEAGQGSEPNVTEVALALAEAKLALSRGADPAKGDGDGRDKSSEVNDPRTQAILNKLEEVIPMVFETETDLETVLKHVQKATQTAEMPKGIPIYVDQAKLQEHDKSLQSRIKPVKIEGVPLKKSLQTILDQHDLMYDVAHGLVRIALKGDEFATSRRGAPGRFSSKGSEPGQGNKAGEGKGYQPGGKDGRSKLILDKLDDPLTMPFEAETPLEDIVKYIQASTASPDLPKGLPIYLDIGALQEEDKTAQSTIKGINFEGVPLRTSLRFIVRQLGLDYMVEDGVLMIGNRRGLSEIRARGPLYEMTESDVQEILRQGDATAALVKRLEDEGLLNPALKKAIEEYKKERLMDAAKNPGGGGFQ